MDVELTQGAISAVDEFMRLAGSDDEDVAGVGLAFLTASIS